MPPKIYVPFLISLLKKPQNFGGLKNNPYLCNHKITILTLNPHYFTTQSNNLHPTLSQIPSLVATTPTRIWLISIRGSLRQRASLLLIPALFVIILHIATHAVIIHIILRGWIKATGLCNPHSHKVRPCELDSRNYSGLIGVSNLGRVRSISTIVEIILAL